MAYFEPSIGRAQARRAEMDGALRASIEHVLREEETENPSDPSNDRSHHGPTELQSTDSRVAISMLDYGAYFDLTLDPPSDEPASQAEKDHARAYLRDRFADGTRFLDESSMRPRLRTLGSADFESPEIARLRRWWDIESDDPIDLAEPSSEETRASSQAIGIAFDRLEETDPVLYGEALALVNDIVLARPLGMQFGGVTSFGLWGGLVLNASIFRAWPMLYGKLVHEVGHNLLFAHARSSPLVSDDPEARAYSHFRDSQRPIDGIFHAAFVGAREALAYDGLLVRDDRNSFMNSEERELTETLLSVAVNAFWGCSQTLRSNGHPTELGDEILSECEAWMRDNFAFADS